MENNSRAMLKVIAFELNGEEYALPVEHVGAIERMHQITRVPGTASFVKGVINLRGVIIPVIDLRTRFGIKPSTVTEENRMIIVHSNNRQVGIVVDAANDVIDLPHEIIEAPPEVIGNVHVDYVEGVAKLEKRLLVLLNLESVLASDELTIEEQVKDGN